MCGQIFAYKKNFKLKIMMVAKNDNHWITEYRLQTGTYECEWVKHPLANQGQGSYSPF